MVERARAAGGVGWGEPARGRPASPEGSPPGGAPKGPPGGRGPPPRGAGAGSSPSAMESTLVANQVGECVVYRERDHSRCESGVVRGEWWWGRVNIEGNYASCSPIVSDLPRLLTRHVLGPYRSNSGGMARVSDGCGFRVGGGRGVAAGAGWGCSRWCSRSTVGVAIVISLRVLGAACCSVSTGTAVASLRAAFLVGSVRRDGVVCPLGSV